MRRVKHRERLIIETLPQTQDNLIATRLSGNVTAEEYETFLSQLEREVETHESLRWYCELQDFNRVSFQALLKDVQFDFIHSCEVTLQRAAIVSNQDWAEWVAGALDLVGQFWPIPTEEARQFDWAEREAALAWVQA